MRAKNKFIETYYWNYDFCGISPQGRLIKLENRPKYHTSRRRKWGEEGGVAVYSLVIYFYFLIRIGHKSPYCPEPMGLWHS